MSGTVSHDIAKILNYIIRPYLDNTYIVKSSTELILKLNEIEINRNSILSSLDLTSLFTNVPVNDTISIILQDVYHHETLAPPKIPRTLLENLLHICTTEKPFEFNEKFYIQVDGVSMGSPLGPTFADFYMSRLENNILKNNNVCNPTLYIRYVDDILTIFNERQHINKFKQLLEDKSVLKFTYEISENKQFNFLDVHLFIKNNGKIDTGVHIKNTD